MDMTDEGNFRTRSGVQTLLFAIALLSTAVCGNGQSSVRPGECGVFLSEKPGGGATFRVWAPKASSVAVAGSFNQWNPSKGVLKREASGGLWSGNFPSARAGDTYMLSIDGGEMKRDPRARAIGEDGKCVIYDAKAFDWGDDDKFVSSGSLKDLVIYQLHPGVFADPLPGDEKPGTLRDAIGKLDHLSSLGVNCVLLMPVNEFPGERSWGYNPSDLFAVERAYGGPDALKEFVKACHKRGISVHLDVVHNHYGPDDLSLWDFDGAGDGGCYFYKTPEKRETPWGPRPDYGQRQVRNFILDQIRMWFDEYHIDGLRWDSTVNIRAFDNGQRGNPEGEKLLDEVAGMLRQEYPGKLSIAEDSPGDHRFDASWEYDFHHSGDEGVVPSLVGEAPVEREQIASRLGGRLGLKRVIYVENHDETGALNENTRLVREARRGEGGADADLRAMRIARLGAVFTLTGVGVPLIFMGQETLEDKEFHDSNPIDWALNADGKKTIKLFGDLIRMRRNLGGGFGGLQSKHVRVSKNRGNGGLLSYKRYVPGKPRETVFIVVNLSESSVKERIAFPHSGEWSLALNTDEPEYGAGSTNLATVRRRTDGEQKIEVLLAPLSAQIFTGNDLKEDAEVAVRENEGDWAGVEDGEEGGWVSMDGGSGAGAIEASEPSPLLTEFRQVVMVANFTQPSPWSLSSGIQMGLVEDYVWQCELSFVNASNVQFKLVTPQNGVQYGGTGFSDSRMPVIGTVAEYGAPLTVPGPLNGDYTLTFNEKTLRYRFEKKATSRYERLNIVGNFNSWSRTRDPMYMVDDNLWQAEVEVDENGVLEFIFVADGTLEKQWGAEMVSPQKLPTQGAATELASPIRLQGPYKGFLRITYNEESGEFSAKEIQSSEVPPPIPVPSPQPAPEKRHVPKKLPLSPSIPGTR